MQVQSSAVKTKEKIYENPSRKRGRGKRRQAAVGRKAKSSAGKPSDPENSHLHLKQKEIECRKSREQQAAPRVTQETQCIYRERGRQSPQNPLIGKSRQAAAEEKKIQNSTKEKA